MGLYQYIVYYRHWPDCLRHLQTSDIGFSERFCSDAGLIRGLKTTVVSTLETVFGPGTHLFQWVDPLTGETVRRGTQLYSVSDQGRTPFNPGAPGFKTYLVCAGCTRISDQGRTPFPVSGCTRALSTAPYRLHCWKLEKVRRVRNFTRALGTSLVVRVRTQLHSRL